MKLARYWFLIIFLVSFNLFASTRCIEGSNIVSQVLIDVKPPHDVVEDNLDSAWMRFMYIPTSEFTVKKYLSFSVGDELNEEKIQESMRKLRAASFIWDVDYKIVRINDCESKVEVVVFDTFPFKPKLSFSRRSGTNKSSIGISNTNLFGTGTRLQFEHKSEKLRDQNVLKYDNPDFGDGHYLFSGVYSDNTDGKESFLRLAKPFYELDSENYYNAQLSQFEGDLTLYDNAEITYITPILKQNHQLAYGINNGDQFSFERSRLYFIGRYDQAEYLLNSELDREVITLASRLELFNTQFIEVNNIKNMTKTEDYDLGTAISLDFGLAYDRMSQENGIYAAIDFTKNIQFDEFHLLLANFGYRGEYFGNYLDENYWYGRFQLNRFAEDFQQSWNVKINFDAFDNPKPENLLVMDEEFGVRGYPYGYVLGDKAIKLNLEKRWFNLTRFFDVFDIAAAVFYDAAIIYADDTQFINKHTTQLQSVGLGLRISPTRLSNNTVIHVDFGIPLENQADQSYQLNVYAKSHF